MEPMKDEEPGQDPGVPGKDIRGSGDPGPPTGPRMAPLSSMTPENENMPPFQCQKSKIASRARKCI